jgi:hypothetical protein
MNRQAQDDPTRSGWQAAFTPFDKRHPELVEGCGLLKECGLSYSDDEGNSRPQAITHNKILHLLFHKNEDFMRLYSAM